MTIDDTDLADRHVLLVSRHDYRSGWRANFHFLAEAFLALGARVSFISTGFSFLSVLRGDRRCAISAHANRWQNVNGVDCLLWKTVFHPVRADNRWLGMVMTSLFRWWPRLPSGILDRAAAAADIILVESDLSAVLLRRLRRKAPNATILYIASDLLATIGAAPQIERALYDGRAAIDHVVAVARPMIPALEALGRPVHYIPHGIQPEDFVEDGPSPYVAPRNAVTVGSMLFDAGAIEAAATAMSDMTFHLIGTPPCRLPLPNVVEHGPMPFRETIPWLRHADVGIAPYRRDAAAGYLADSSFKLMQYGYLGLPAVCPDFAVGDHPLRFGYVPGDPDSVVAAFAAALSPEVRRDQASAPTWNDIAKRMALLRCA